MTHDDDVESMRGRLLVAGGSLLGMNEFFKLPSTGTDRKNALPGIPPTC